MNSPNTSSDGQAPGFWRWLPAPVVRFIAPPVFEGDEEKTRVASLLNTVVFSLTLLIPVVVANLILVPANGLILAPVGVVLVVLLAALYWLMRRGYVRGASILLITTTALLVGYINVQAAGEFRPVVVIVAAVIVVGGLLLGGRGAMITAIVFILLSIVATGAGLNGLIQARGAPPTPVSGLVTITVGYLLVGLIFRLASNSIQGTLQRARASERTLAESNRELQILRTALEERVAERTRDLALAAEVGQRVSEVRDLDALLTGAVELIRSRFDLYYAQVYLTNATATALELRAGTGDVGRELLRRAHRLPIGPGSLNGRAASEKQAVIVSDTTTNPSFRPNPLLPETRSEMSVPLIAGPRVVGVLDLQSTRPGALTEDNLPAFQAMAGQLAIAIQNANLFAETQAARAEVEARARRLTRAGWREFLDAVERSETFGFTYDQTAMRPLTEPLTPETEHSLAVPVTVAGEPVGTLQLEASAGRLWTKDDSALATLVARQVAQQVENLRLLAQADQARAEAEQATRRLTREGWEGYLQSAKTLGEGFTYDLNRVAPYPLTGEPGGNGQPPLAHALTVQGESIGELAVLSASGLSASQAGLIATVAERLSAHIENLRLAEQTQQALSQTEEQARRLALLNELGDELNRADTFNDILKVIGGKLPRLFVADRVSVALLNPAGEFEYLEVQGEQIFPLGTKLPYANTALGQVATDRHILRFADTRASPLLDTQAASQRGLLSALIAPLLDGEHCLGVLNLSARAVEAYSLGDENFLTQTMALVNSALSKQKAFEQMQSALTFMTALQETALGLMGRLDITSLLQSLITRAGELLGTPHGYLFLLEPGGSDMRMQIGTGIYQTFIGYRLKPGEAVVGTIWQSGEPLVINDYQNWANHLQLANLESIHSVAGAPLKSGAQVVGVIGLAHIEAGRQFSEPELSALTRFAQLAAVALDNARLYTGIQESQARMRTLIENAPEAIVVVDLETGLFTEPNQNAVKFYGLPYEELVKVGPAQMSPPLQPDDRDSTEKAMEKIGEAMQGGTPVFEWIHRNAQGRDIPCEIRLVRLPGEHPQVRASVTDITERKQAEATLAKRAVELATVAEVSTVASTSLEAERLLQEVVDLTKDRFGLYHAHIYLLDEAAETLNLAVGAGAVGRTLVAQQHAIPLNREQSLVARAARTKQGVIVNDVRAAPDFLPNSLLPDTRAEMAIPLVVGERVLGVFDVQADAVNHFTDEDLRVQTTLAGQVAVALQNANLYAEQAATVTRLRELDHLKSSFLANMSHELRTPLNSIIGFTDVMLEGINGPLTEFMENDLNVIRKNGQHLLNLINDVLDMAKIEAGRLTLSLEEFDMLEVLSEVLDITSPLARDKQLDLRIDMDFHDPITLTADRFRLRQVMINLINNSIKFTDEGGITVKGTRHGDLARITVKDTGLGIPASHLESVFQEFTQVDTTTTRKVSGTGLGLPISRHLIEMHGGRLWAESTGVEREGSAFIIELPMTVRTGEPVAE